MNPLVRIKAKLWQDARADVRARLGVRRQAAAALNAGSKRSLLKK